MMTQRMRGTETLDLQQDADVSGVMFFKAPIKLDRTIVNSSLYTMSGSEVIVARVYQAGQTTIWLPDPAANANKVFIIKDESGLASANPIVIQGYQIEGVQPYTINTNYGFVVIYSDGINYFILSKG